MQQRKNREYRGAALVFLAGSLWGIIGLFVKEMESAGADPSAISLLRVAFAFLIMTGITAGKYGLKAFRVDKKTLFACALLGVICHGVYNIFYSLSVTMAGVSVSAVLLNIAPVFTLFFSRICFGEKLTRGKVLAVVMNILGCILTVTNGKIDAGVFSGMGVLCGVGAGICYSLTAIIGKVASNRTNPFVMSAYSYLFAALSLLAWMRPWRQTVVLNQNILFWGFFYALIPTALAYILYYWGIRQIRESSKVPVIASVETVVAAFIGVLGYGERLGVVSLLGAALVLASIGVMSLSATGRIK